jgi:hypothetical protein
VSCLLADGSLSSQIAALLELIETPEARGAHEGQMPGQCQTSCPAPASTLYGRPLGLRLEKDGWADRTNP